MRDSGFIYLLIQLARGVPALTPVRLYNAGPPSSHPLAVCCLADLVRKQRLDGSWAPEEGEGEEGAVNATLGALRSLKGYGRI